MTEKEVFIGSDDKNLYRIDLKSGMITALYYLGDFVYSPVVAKGHVLVGTYGNHLYCLGHVRVSEMVLAIAAITVILLLVLILRRFKFHSESL